MRNLQEAALARIPEAERDMDPIERRRKMQREYRSTRPEYKEKARQWRLNNLDKCKEYGRTKYERHREKLKARQRTYNLKRREAMHDYNQRYHAEHREECQQRDREYHAAHREERNAKARQWAAEHVEERKAWGEEYRRKNLEAIKARNRNRYAQLRSLEGTHTAADIEDLFTVQGGKCAGCKKPLRKSGKSKTFHVDHVMPVIRGGSNDASNLQLLCPRCNIQKKAKTPEQWAEQIGKLFV
jgi:5-methylcytosine-specific restriction endonuclease McrA